MELKTELGKIFYKYNEEKEDYDLKRVIKINNKKNVIITDLDRDYRIIENTEKAYSIDEEYSSFRKEWTELKSDGMVSASAVLSVPQEEFGIDVRDVILIFFPNAKGSTTPDSDQPYVVARQGITNIFAEMAGMELVGLSISIDTLPSGYALSDFMENHRVIRSSLTHVYKIDDNTTIGKILSDADDLYDTILRELFNKRIHYLQNTKPEYTYEEKSDDCVDGYCNTLTKFIIESDFLNDIRLKMGIIKVDFEMETNKPLNNDDKLVLMTLYGGIHIDKAVPLKFDYDIDMKCIRMKYIMAYDKKNELFIIPYTESKDEIDASEVYKLTEERTNQLQQRLSSIVKAYDNSKK